MKILYLYSLDQFESLPPGIIKSDLVRTSCDEDVSIPGMSPTEHFLAVLGHLLSIAGQHPWMGQD